MQEQQPTNTSYDYALDEVFPYTRITTSEQFEEMFRALEEEKWDK